MIFIPTKGFNRVRFPNESGPKPSWKKKIVTTTSTNSVHMKSSFQKGLSPLLVEIELLVEYSKVSKTTNFDTNFMSLAYSVPKLWSSVISGIFRKISDF